MTVFNIILKDFDYYGDMRHKYWNDITSWYVDSTVDEIETKLAIFNTYLKNKEIGVFEKQRISLQNSITKFEEKIALKKTLTPEQLEILGLSVTGNRTDESNLASLKSGLERKEEEIAKFIANPNSQTKRYFYEKLDLDDLEDVWNEYYD